MKRYCFTLQIDPQKLDAYKEYHAQVWPEMLIALKESGWRNYTIFVNESGNLFGYFETSDLNAALREMSSREVNSRWQNEMKPFFMHDGSPSDSNIYTSFQEVFNLEDQLEKSS